MEYDKDRSDVQNRKVMHKIGKQWTVISLSLLAMLGGSALVNKSGIHAASTPQTTSVQSAGVRQPASTRQGNSIDNQAAALHNQILNRNLNQVQKQTQPVVTRPAVSSPVTGATPDSVNQRRPDTSVQLIYKDANDPNNRSAWHYSTIVGQQGDPIHYSDYTGASDFPDGYQFYKLDDHNDNLFSDSPGNAVIWMKRIGSKIKSANQSVPTAAKSKSKSQTKQIGTIYITYLAPGSHVIKTISVPGPVGSAFSLADYERLSGYRFDHVVAGSNVADFGTRPQYVILLMKNPQSSSASNSHHSAAFGSAASGGSNRSSASSGTGSRSAAKSSSAAKSNGSKSDSQGKKARSTSKKFKSNRSARHVNRRRGRHASKRGNRKARKALRQLTRGRHSRHQVNTQLSRLSRIANSGAENNPVAPAGSEWVDDQTADGQGAFSASTSLDDDDDAVSTQDDVNSANESGNLPQTSEIRNQALLAFTATLLSLSAALAIAARHLRRRD